MKQELKINKIDLAKVKEDLRVNYLHANCNNETNRNFIYKSEIALNCRPCCDHDELQSGKII